MNDHSQEELDRDLERAYWNTKTDNEAWCFWHRDTLVAYCLMAGAAMGALFGFLVSLIFYSPNIYAAWYSSKFKSGLLVIALALIIWLAYLQTMEIARKWLK